MEGIIPKLKPGIENEDDDRKMHDVFNAFL